jgi:mannose-6-phosphate isomerase-like protein (cupin superfamily)
VINRNDREPPEEQLVLAPPQGGTRIRFLDIPPDSDDLHDLDEVFENIGGADAHQPGSDRHASFHRTRTIDYGIVLHGEVTLLLDDGETIVRAGDVVVQRGTNHGWANRSGGPCRIAFILIDGELREGLAD